MIFPDDDNGDVLRRMSAKGDALTRSRNIDFTVVFPEQSLAEQFAEHFRDQGYSVSINGSNSKEGFSWDVVVVKNMIPTHQAIGEFEAILQQVAERFAGHNDGWGCFTQQD